MNDVASTTLVTVKRPAMSAHDFSQALRDLEQLGFLRLHHVAIDEAIVERKEMTVTSLVHDVGHKPEAVPGRVSKERENDRVDSPVTAIDPDFYDRTTEETTMTEATLDTVRTLIAEGATTNAELRAAKELADVAPKKIDNWITALRTKGEILKTGTPGVFRVAKRSKAGRQSKRDATKQALVATVAAAHVSTPRFTMRYFGAHIECTNASDVAELLRALRSE